jgi:hypothetical protein
MVRPPKERNEKNEKNKNRPKAKGLRLQVRQRPARREGLSLNPSPDPLPRERGETAKAVAETGWRTGREAIVENSNSIVSQKKRVVQRKAKNVKERVCPRILAAVAVVGARYISPVPCPAG